MEHTLCMSYWININNEAKKIIQRHNKSYKSISVTSDSIDKFMNKTA